MEITYLFIKKALKTRTRGLGSSNKKNHIVFLFFKEVVQMIPKLNIFVLLFIIFHVDSKTQNQYK